ncbi:hypothetical protein XTPLMG728_3857 [Xanthomonas translucens pv. poae]|uniref:Pirin C-terminal domain-containing protein n=1 Tax=Xanthomonas graminis pv. poae TaxID=227946 RepID=A0A0K3AD86_9XANT|nr:hypothetical protein KM539_06665 [Xanthomonas translucens pv. poae]CTP93475.1 hypothetical protein XTPLMG728_3857 [Xanthomonas translucens pv. poae]
MLGECIGRRDAVVRGKARAAGAVPAVPGGGQGLQLQAGDAGARPILLAGRPLREPVARHAFVVNTREALVQAFVDFQEGRLQRLGVSIDTP